MAKASSLSLLPMPENRDCSGSAAHAQDVGEARLEPDEEEKHHNT